MPVQVRRSLGTATSNASIGTDIGDRELPCRCVLSDLYLCTFALGQVSEDKALCGMEKDAMNMDDNDTITCGCEAPDGSDDILNCAGIVMCLVVFPQSS